MVIEQLQNLHTLSFKYDFLCSSDFALYVLLWMVYSWVQGLFKITLYYLWGSGTICIHFAFCFPKTPLGKITLGMLLLPKSCFYSVFFPLQITHNLTPIYSWPNTTSIFDDVFHFENKKLLFSNPPLPPHKKKGSPVH